MLKARLGDLAKGEAAQCPTDFAEMLAPREFPGGAVVKNPPANAGDMGSIPGPGGSHMPRSN